jgi:predicted O-linked N-acetylglucosamine transferase (SPINDLY family)
MLSIQQALDLAWRHLQAGQWQQAEQLYLQILQVQPNQVDALHLLGLIAGQTGRDALAVDYLGAALRLKPDFAAAHINLGNVFMNQKKFPEAVASYRRAVSAKPDIAVAHNNLGNALRSQGELAQAVASLHEALRLLPTYAEAFNNLAMVLEELGGFVEAEASAREAIRLKPDYAEAHYNLAFVLWRQTKLDDAAASCERALKLKPDYIEALQGLGDARKEQGRLDDALDANRRALQIKPDAANVHSALVMLLNYHPDYGAESIYQEALRWNQRHAEPLKKHIKPHLNNPDSDRRLRIGYVSPDFRTHPSAFFIVPLLSNHDHKEFEIFCYSQVARPDAVTEQHRSYADVWHSSVRLSDDELAEQIRSDQIDILVDLAMHAANNRLLALARKPAPIQVAWLAYPGTTGLSTMDYRLTDPYLDPPGLFDAFYSEESIRLPDTFWCYDPLTVEPPVNALPAKGYGAITFGCLNNFCKLNDGVLALWAKVLQAVPNSRLLFLVPPGEARGRVLACLENEAVSASRVKFIGRRPRSEYLQLYHQIDLCLDPFPCSGHTTSLDASWMGVPTITLVGKTAMGRAGWSQLCNLGLKELAADTPDEYVANASRLASDLPRLEEIRGSLRQRMMQSPLMDAPRFTRNMEQVYRQLWRRWCSARG